MLGRRIPLLCNLREEKLDVFVEDEKEGPMFKIHGSCLRRVFDVVVARPESVRMFLSILTLQKLYWPYSDLWSRAELAYSFTDHVAHIEAGQQEV